MVIKLIATMRKLNANSRRGFRGISREYLNIHLSIYEICSILTNYLFNLNYHKFQ